MSGQIAQVGAQMQLNALWGNVVPVVQSTAPTWVPGLFWIDSGNAYVVKAWNGSAWVVTTGQRYLCLLTSDPTPTGGPYAVNISDLVEVTTPGYGRQVVDVGNASAAYPSVVANNALISWGPFTDDMAVPTAWVALVTASSGNSGQLLYTWDVAPQQVDASEMVQISTSELTNSNS